MADSEEVPQHVEPQEEGHAEEGAPPVVDGDEGDEQPDDEAPQAQEEGVEEGGAQDATDVAAETAPPAEQTEGAPLEPLSETVAGGPQSAEEADQDPGDVDGGDAAPSAQEAAEASGAAAAAPPPFFADPAEGTMIVRFTARPEGFFFQQSFPVRSPCLIMYKRLETQLHLERRSMQLYWDGRPLGDSEVAADVCVLPDADDVPLFMDLEIENVPDFLRTLNPSEQVVKVVKTQVSYGDDIPQKTYHVTIVKGFEKKPFIGGWKHTKKNFVFHNAATQCSVEKSSGNDLAGKLSRTTQTLGVTRSCQTRRECGTQMPKPDLLVDETYDRVRVAKPYFSADRLATLQTQKTVVLQAFVRGWRARKIARRMRAERDAEEEALASEDSRRRNEHQQRRADEIQRRTHPTTTQDFSVLHNELEAWRLQEVQRIHDANISEAERRIAMTELLKKQTRLLQTIDRLQIQASKENRFRRINNVLNKMSSAKLWGTQTAIHVETPFTVRARELRDLYDGLQLNGIGIDERLDILLHVKWTVKEFECPLTREIVELVDREADLLNRGRRENSLSGLRQRLSNLFLQFVETPEFNPEAAQFQRVPLEYTSRPLVKLDQK